MRYTQTHHYFCSNSHEFSVSSTERPRDQISCLILGCKGLARLQSYSQHQARERKILRRQACFDRTVERNGFAMELFEWRVANRITQQQAAKALGSVCLETYGNWERGRRIPGQTLRSLLREKMETYNENSKTSLSADAV